MTLCGGRELLVEGEGPFSSLLIGKKVQEQLSAEKKWKIYGRNRNQNIKKMASESENKSEK
jgi:hypothetical protein